MLDNVPITSHDGEINFLDYWRIIKKRRRMITVIVAVASVLAVVWSLHLPKSYRAEALIIPVPARGGGGASSLSSQFGSLALLAGVSLPGGADETSKFVTFLNSRTLTENVIGRENLMPVLFENSWDKETGRWKSDDPKKQPNMETAVGIMKGHVAIMDDKKNKSIKISGEFNAPELAARVVNAYLDELQKFINDNAFTMAKRNRLFVEGQLEQNKQELLEAGKEINQFYKGGRISSAEAKVDVPINRGTSHVTSGTPGGSSVTGGAFLASNDPETETNGSGVSGDVPLIGGHEGELDGLLAQKSDLEKKITVAKTVKDVPQQVYLTYLMLRRELLAKVNALLTSQYEMAKIEESKEDLAFQVIDKAVPPVKKFKPKRAHICWTAFIASLLGAILLVFFLEYLARMKALDAARNL
ncbi:MAG: Wzz/FepE/Etk N-terminal domain-containing protein [Pseudomonadota bacterium]